MISTSLDLEASERALLSRFVPICCPVVGADAQGVLTVNLALVFILAGLLQAEEPFIVSVPAVESLVG